MSQADTDYEAWKAFHQGQLVAMGLPEDLHRKLFMKLKFEDYDFSQHVQIILEEETNQTDMMCIKEMKAESDVFLVDHAWTFRYQDAYSTLSSNQALFERLEKITEKWTEKKDLETETENKEEEVKVQSLEELFAKYE